MCGGDRGQRTGSTGHWVSGVASLKCGMWQARGVSTFLTLSHSGVSLAVWLICLTWGHRLDGYVGRLAHPLPRAARELYLVVVLLINICTSVKISLRRCAYI